MRLLFACIVICCCQLARAQESTSKSTQLAGGKTLRIVLVGDSTVTDVSGWGHGFKKCLGNGVECINAAQNGRSSKSFRAEGRWEPVLAMKPDYVLLQFGHNDQPGKGPERESPADTEFRANMRRYVEEAQATGIQPILVTSLVRRKFEADGTIHSDLTEYVEVVKQVAEETKTPLIDLHARSLALCNSLGAEGCKSIDPIDAGKQDTTHLNERGSEIIGELVAEELVRVVPELAPSIKVDAAGKSESRVN
jgi:lysophospholipase L1-like esterase